MAIGIRDYGTVAGTIAATSALQAQMAATTAVTEQIGNAILPPGMEGASALSTVQQHASNADFGTKLRVGIEELMKRNGVMGLHSEAVAADDLAGALGVQSVPIGFA